MKQLLFVLVGLSAGVLSGLIGIGGGIIMIPALIIIFGFSQHAAQGTTLAAMVPPIGLMAAYVYYKDGFVNTPAAVFIVLGFCVGGFVGAEFATHINKTLLERIFGAMMIIIGIKSFLGK